MQAYYNDSKVVRNSEFLSLVKVAHNYPLTKSTSRDCNTRFALSSTQITHSTSRHCNTSFTLSSIQITSFAATSVTSNMAQPVKFLSKGIAIAGNLHRSSSTATSRKRAAIVISHPFAGVKEQVAASTPSYLQAKASSR
jgi:hypothetical protein